MKTNPGIYQIPLEMSDWSGLWPRLAGDPKPPKQLFARFTGDRKDFRTIFQQPSVAIVGSRKASAYGREVTLRLARELAEHGVVIIAGLAIGIDSLAHRGALDGHGTTIAVLGNGLSHIYPAQNRGLATEILANNGIILSEYEPDVPVARYQFLERNRLISALSDIVIVVEANLRSGSLNTARHALEQGKILMAVPGNITAPLSSGTNQLIANDATPLLNTESVLEKLRKIYVDEPTAIAKLNDQSSQNSTTGDEIQDQILAKLAHGSATTDEILREFPNAQASLTMLEINNKIIKVSDHWTKI